MFDYTNRQLEEMIDADRERLQALETRVTELEHEVRRLQHQITSLTLISLERAWARLLQGEDRLHQGAIPREQATGNNRSPVRHADWLCCRSSRRNNEAGDVMTLNSVIATQAAVDFFRQLILVETAA